MANLTGSSVFSLRWVSRETLRQLFMRGIVRRSHSLDVASWGNKISNVVITCRQIRLSRQCPKTVKRSNNLSSCLHNISAGDLWFQQFCITLKPVPIKLKSDLTIKNLDVLTFRLKLAVSNVHICVDKEDFHRRTRFSCEQFPA